MSDTPLEPNPIPLPAASFRRYWALLAHYLKPQARRAVWMAVLLLAGLALQLANPQIIRYFLDTAQTGGESRYLLAAGGLFIAFALLQQALKLAAGYASKDVGWSSTNRLRADLTLHCLRLDMPFYKRFTPGDLIERIDGDVTLLANFFSAFAVRVLGNALLVLGILALLAREDLRVGAGMLVYTIVTLWCWAASKSWPCRSGQPNARLQPNFTAISRSASAAQRRSAPRGPRPTPCVACTA